MADIEAADNRFVNYAEKQLMQETKDKLHNYKFQDKKSIELTGCEPLTLFDIDYFKLGLNALENLADGEVTLAQRLKVRRHYAPNKTHPEGNMVCMVTEVTDITQAGKYKANVGIVHGMAQCSDPFIEPAIHFALNGFRVILVDLQGFGFTQGPRILRLSIEIFHH